MVSKIGPNWFQKLDQILKRNLKYSFNFYLWKSDGQEITCIRNFYLKTFAYGKSVSYLFQISF